MTRSSDIPSVVVVNPLRETLAHYERELLETLKLAGFDSVEVIPTVVGEGFSGGLSRARIAMRAVLERFAMRRTVRDRIVIVAWPLFGYLEALTLLPLARRNRVFIVMHDPSPLRRSYGYSRLAKRVCRLTVNRRNIQILYHTELARTVGERAGNHQGVVIPHPVLMSSEACPDHVPAAGAAPAVRVLGQYKRTRSLAALQGISGDGTCDLRLEIFGRKWPAVPGWRIVDQFIPEDDFGSLIATADCVVIPYDAFFQSGVAARCLEAGVPVVGPRHEHIAELFGDDWPGMVRDAGDWSPAVQRCLETGRAEIGERRLRAQAKVRRAWTEFFNAECGHRTRKDSRLSLT